MTVAGLAILASGVLLLSLGSLPLLAQATAARHKLQTFRALRNRNFRWFWFNTSGSGMAQGMQFLILGWLILELTDSPAKLGVVLFLYGLPNLSLFMFGGIFADRIDRRTVLIATQSIVTVVVFSLATLTTLELVEDWHVYATGFILGTLQALNMPARLAIVADLVDRSDMMNAVSLNSSMMFTGRIIGPAAAGFIIEWIDIGPALYLNAAGYLLATACVLSIRGVPKRPVVKRSSVAGDLAAGIVHVWSSPVVFTIIGIGFAFGFFGMPITQVMPAFAKEILDAGAAEAGLLMTAAAVGSLAGTLTLATLGNFRYKNWLLLGMLLVFGVSLLALSWSLWYRVSLAIMLFVGLGSTGFISMGTAVLQLSVPNDLQGRIMSLWYVSAGLMFIGSLPSAVVADLFDWRIAIAGGAIVFMVVALLMGVARPTLRNLRI
jgi:predicted MFS family arabinose efflux permease